MVYDEVKEDIHKYMCFTLPLPHRSMLETPGKWQKTLVSLNIVRVQMEERGGGE